MPGFQPRSYPLGMQSAAALRLLREIFSLRSALVLTAVLVAATGTLQKRPDVFGDLVAIHPAWYSSVG